MTANATAMPPVVPQAPQPVPVTMTPPVVTEPAPSPAPIGLRNRAQDMVRNRPLTALSAVGLVAAGIGAGLATAFKR